MTTVAVTGTTGYVGGMLASFLNKSGYSVLHLNRHKREQDGQNFIPFALAGHNDYSALNRADVLIHCAYDFSSRGWQQVKNINVDASMELLREAQRQGVKKIIFLSSICAYEGAKSDYGKAKLAVEKQAAALGVIMLRAGTVFSNPAGGIMDTMNSFVRKHSIIPLIGDGGQIFYPCHGDDLCASVLKLLSLPVAPSRPVTAASAEIITYKGLMQLLATTHQKKVFFVPIPCVLLYAAFKTAEILGIKTMRGTDSITNLNTPNLHPDFSETQKLGLSFRPLILEILKN